MTKSFVLFRVIFHFLMMSFVFTHYILGKENDTILNSDNATEVNHYLSDAGQMIRDNRLDSVNSNDSILSNTSTKKKSTPALIKVTDNEKGTDVSIGKDGFIRINDEDDTVKVQVGNKGIKVVEEGAETSVEIIDVDDEGENSFFNKKPKKFKGHWAGLEIGLNTLLDEDLSLSRIPAEDYMDLNTARSWNINLNIIQQNIGFGTDKAGLVTGLGLEFNNYHFDHNNSITKNESGEIIPMLYDSLNINLDKSKLSASYLTLPLIFEFQMLPQKRSKRIYCGLGVVGGLKLGSHTKVVYRESGSKEKNRERDDFSITPLKYGITGRLGYRMVKIYGTYYITPLFEKDKGPQLNPFMVGLSFTF